ncbi:MAG: DEAD/DEAH box helicase [Alphaproteobacteria bacterium]|nr:DEAD/DEAH box helicase [Rickettsiales bacterium]
MSEFSTLQLNPTILKTLQEKNYTTPTPVQSQAIPPLLCGEDLLGIAQTGTGKTAAFLLPILNNLSENKTRFTPNHIRALILTPTRELASQIGRSAYIYGKKLYLKHTVIFGGVNIHAQMRTVSNGVDIVIATPGRLLDLINRGCINFRQLETLVLDEADIMLDMGFVHDIKKIIQKLPPDKQTVMFSATMPKNMLSLTQSILRNPVHVEVAPESTTAKRIKQSVKFVDKPNKLALLQNILEREEVLSVLVFTKTKHKADKVAESLNNMSIKTTAIHGDKSQNARTRALDNFRSGRINILISTDIAARGIDIPGVSHVINYDLPEDPESYVHRIGRTARAGKDGIAISFCDRDEYAALQDIEKIIKCQIPINTTHPYHDDEPRVRKGKSNSNGGGSRRRPYGSRQTNDKKSQDSYGGRKGRRSWR